jgi:hypothetical protein
MMALLGKALGQILNAGNGIRVLWAQHTLAQLQSLTIQRLSCGILVLFVKA